MVSFTNLGQLMTYLKTQVHDAPLFWDNKFFLIFRYAIYESYELLFMQ